MDFIQVEFKLTFFSWAYKSVDQAKTFHSIDNINVPVISRVCEESVNKTHWLGWSSDLNLLEFLSRRFSLQKLRKIYETSMQKDRGIIETLFTHTSV